MELKEIILSTLAEIDGDMAQSQEEQPTIQTHNTPFDNSPKIGQPVSSQREFYSHIRERILVLFEGFQSPNNKNIESKIELTLNFLEYLLATIDEELEKLDHQA